jgi:hypothetical protein
MNSLNLSLAVGVLQLLALATAWSEEPEAEAYRGRPVMLQWKLTGGRVFYQEVLVTQKSNYRIQGLNFGSNVRYSVLSSFTVQKSRYDGSSVVEQKVEATRLLGSDAVSRAVFGGLLQKLIGTTFTMTLSPQMEITSFKGQHEVIHAAGGNPPDWQFLMQASLVDQDGWKELDQLTFFQPGQPLRVGQKWDRELTHSWGALGDWKGQVHYAYLDEQAGSHRISYTLELDHLPPADNGGDLPLKIANAAFKHQEAGGMIYFDSDKGRVSRAEERFHVRGTMAVEMLGQNTALQMEEVQTFQIRVLGKKPLKY